VLNIYLIKKEEACVFAFWQIKVELRVPKNKRLKAIQGLFKGKFGEKSPSVCVCKLREKNQFCIWWKIKGKEKGVEWSGKDKPKGWFLVSEKLVTDDNLA